MSTITIPRTFIWRRLHSLTGLWFVLFLIEHLLVNSQAALLLGDNGREFVNLVNVIHNLPYLPFIEAFLLGVPILLHMYWGVVYLFSAKSNAKKSDGSKPALPEYGRNKAYTWQRITSWILLFLLIGHVVKFRFLEYPDHIFFGDKNYYYVRVDLDQGLYTVAPRLKVMLYDKEQIAKEKADLAARAPEEALLEAAKLITQSHKGVMEESEAVPYDSQKAVILAAAQKFEEKKAWVAALEKVSLSPKEVIAVADNFGTASLLTVRNTFKYPVYVAFYTIFVLAACFHGFNGLWTAMITWGAIFKYSAQKSMVVFCIVLMLIVVFLGLASIWGTYWLNLRS